MDDLCPGVAIVSAYERVKKWLGNQPNLVGKHRQILEKVVEKELNKDHVALFGVIMELREEIDKLYEDKRVRPMAEETWI